MKKISVIALSLLMSISILGCGKKSHSVADSLINEDPSKINGMEQYSNLGNGTNETEEEIEPYTEPEEYTSETVSGETTSDNTVSDNSVSENGVSENSVSDNSTEDGSEDVTIGLNEIETNSAYTPKENNTLSIANLSGRNIKAIYVTFSQGNLKGSEILGSKNLKDGDIYVYTIDDMSSLRNAGILTLSITVIDNKEKDINFGEVKIVDPNNMTVVLTCEDGKYSMYLK